VRIPECLQGRIIDMHAHFFPEQLLASIWEWFAQRMWKINYQDDSDGLARTLESFGVERFVTYNYAHKPGVAAELNRWTAEFAARNPSALPFATVFPGDEGNVAMLEELFDERSFLGIKIQPLVSDFYADDERMWPVYRLLVERQKILAAHAGTAPVANRFVGADHFEPVMREFPEMKVIVAHMGAFEFDRFFAMAREYPNLYLDTSVNFIDRGLVEDLIARGEFPPLKLPSPGDYDRGALIELSDRILFGSDYPNIPYDYEACIESVLALDLGGEFNRAVFFGNARRLLQSD
jgi:predicted TIM-barrel fold metal-dependent hydrolase